LEPGLDVKIRTKMNPPSPPQMAPITPGELTPTKGSTTPASSPSRVHATNPIKIFFIIRIASVYQALLISDLLEDC
jgi:cell division septation protein DedD